MAKMAKNVRGNNRSDSDQMLTPQQEAQLNAKLYAELAAQKAALEAKMEEVKEQMINYAISNNEFDLGAVTVVPMAGKPKLDYGSLTAKAREQVNNRLIAQLPDYVITEKKLDVESLYIARASNPVVANALQVAGIGILEPVETFQIRRAK